MKPLIKQALQVQAPQIKAPGKKQAGRFIQSGYLKWGLGVCCSGAMLAALSIWTVSLNANNADFTALDVVSKNSEPNFAGNDLQGDALEVAAVETEEALKSVLLGASYAGDRMVVVGVRGHILYSDDHGNSWSQANVPVRSTLTSVFFITPEKGWAVGNSTSYIDKEKSWMADVMTNEKKQFALLVSHQDQVTRLPAQAELIASNTFCPNASFQIANHILCFQGHPEFSADYLNYLMNKWHLNMRICL